MEPTKQINTFIMTPSEVSERAKACANELCTEDDDEYLTLKASEIRFYLRLAYIMGVELLYKYETKELMNIE